MNEIIIHGVNVLKCPHYHNDDFCDYINSTSLYCSCQKECFFKQLLTLHDKNKELADIIAMKNEDIQNLERSNHDYRTALEEIKAILDKECSIISNAKAVGIINEVLK